MQADDYTPTTRGSLKLKAVHGSKISKPKKKRKRAVVAEPQENALATTSVAQQTGNSTAEAASAEGETARGVVDGAKEISLRDALASEDEKDDRGEEEAGGDTRSTAHGARMTEAEKRHGEQRRKRLDERLKREGIKTHKERVEELNRYLSRLSEHHDMPRIGPG